MLNTTRVKTKTGLISYPTIDKKSIKTIRQNKGVYCDLLELTLDRYLYPGDTFVDIGSYVGYFSNYASKIVGDTGCVYSFEPARENFDILCSNLKKNINCFTLKSAILDIKDEVTLYKDSTEPKYTSIVNFKSSDKQEKVQAVRLDDLVFESVKLIKINACGAEDMVLHGAEQTIKKWKPIVIASFNKQQIEKTGASPLEVLDSYDSLGYYWKFIHYENGEGQLLLRPE